MLRHSFLLIVPCKNEENNIVNFISEAEKLKNIIDTFDICFIDDGSEDKTWDNIKLASKSNKIVKGIKLSKNFGKDSMIEAGLNYSVKEYDYYNY